MIAKRNRAAAAGRPGDSECVSLGLSLSHGIDRATQGVRGSEANGRISERHRTVDTLSRMLEATTISPEMYEAARSFQTDFALAALDPIRARPMLLPVGGGGASELTDRQLDARRRVHQALDALGGIGSPAGSCVWHVVGLQRSVREWATRQGWGGRTVRQEQAQGILIAGLGMLARHFGYEKAASSRSPRSRARAWRLPPSVEWHSSRPQPNSLAFPIAAPTSEAAPTSGISVIGTASPFGAGQPGARHENRHHRRRPNRRHPYPSPHRARARGSSWPTHADPKRSPT